MEKSEVIEFNGIKFRRYPNSRRWADRMYYVPNSAHRKRGIGRLHQEIWKAAYGEIPAGCEIHHKDHNPLNNSLENLECINSSEHKQGHAETMPQKRREWLQTHIKRIRPKAANWHKTDEGREFHRQLGKQSWNRKPVKRICEQCGAEYETKVTRGNARFCSNKCKAKARRESGIDDEPRNCLYCGDQFVVNRYSVQRFCSKRCSTLHWRANKN